MSLKEKHIQYLSLKAFFESGSVKKMKDIEELFPTMVAKDLGMNHSRYIVKLHNPQLFSYEQIFKLGNLININPKFISDIIIDEIINRTKNRRLKK